MMYSLPLIALIVTAVVNSASGGLMLQLNASLNVNWPELYNKVVLTARNDINFFLSAETEAPVESSVRFYCGNRKHPDLQLTLPDSYDLKVKLDINKSIMFVVHGWTESSTNQYIRDVVHDSLTFLDINVCTIDWTRLAHYEFQASVNYTWIVSDEAVKFIKIAFELGITPQSIILVGHGLGAHINGQIGYKFNGSIGQIYGLDPPKIEIESQSAQLDRSDAQYVQIILSANGTLSAAYDAHEVFYINTGSAPQPNCVSESNSTYTDIQFAEMLICSHLHAYTIFRFSINPVLPYPARFCSSWDDYKYGKCVFNQMTRVGIFSTKKGGVFYLKTTSKSPYNLI